MVKNSDIGFWHCGYGVVEVIEENADSIDAGRQPITVIYFEAPAASGEPPPQNNGDAVIETTRKSRWWSV